MWNMKKCWSLKNAWALLEFFPWESVYQPFPCEPKLVLCMHLPTLAIYICNLLFNFWGKRVGLVGEEVGGEAGGGGRGRWHSFHFAISFCKALTAWKFCWNYLAPTVLTSCITTIVFLSAPLSGTVATPGLKDLRTWRPSPKIHGQEYGLQEPNLRARNRVPQTSSSPRTRKQLGTQK